MVVLHMGEMKDDDQERRKFFVKGIEDSIEKGD